MEIIIITTLVWVACFPLTFMLCKYQCLQHFDYTKADRTFFVWWGLLGGPVFLVMITSEILLGKLPDRSDEVITKRRTR